MRKLFKGRSTERDAFRIPRSVQQSIPIKRIYKDGIFRVSGRFSKTWRFFDINYAVASPEKQLELFLGYCGVLNSLPIDAGIKLTLVNRQLNRQEFSRNLLMAYKKIIDLADVILCVYDADTPLTGGAEDRALAYAEGQQKSLRLLHPTELTTKQISADHDAR